MAVSTLTEKEEMNESIAERKLVVHKIAINLEAAKGIVEKGKTKFFAKLGFIKPKHGEIECESVHLFYEPFIVAKASYFLDYYKKNTYSIRVGEEVKEVIAFGHTLKPEFVKERSILKRPHKAIAFDAQERVIYRAVTHMALNRTGHEIDPTRLPTGPTEPEPKKNLQKANDKVKELKVKPETILDMIRKRTTRRPPDVARVAEEAFEVTEYTITCTPVYEARCKRLKTGEIKIIPISGVTGEMLSL